VLREVSIDSGADGRMESVSTDLLEQSEALQLVLNRIFHFRELFKKRCQLFVGCPVTREMFLDKIGQCNCVILRGSCKLLILRKCTQRADCRKFRSKSREFAKY